MKIHRKFSVLVVSGVLAVGVVSTLISFYARVRGAERVRAQMRGLLMEAKKEKLKDLTLSAHKLLDQAWKSGGSKDNDKAAQEEAKRLIGVMRYGPENADYFWINDLRPVMVMHPYKTELNGKDLSDYADPNGKKLFMEFVKTCNENGEGFVNYMWPKPGKDKPVPKLSYVKIFKPWGWILGTGIYFDDVDATMAHVEAVQRASIRGQLWAQAGAILAVTLLVAVVSAVFSRRMTAPIERTTSMLRDVAEGEGDLTKRLSAESEDEIGEMARWFNTFIERVQSVVREIAEGAVTVSASSAELSGLSAQMSDGADGLFGKSKTVAAAAEAMSSNMSAVAAAVEQATTNLGIIATAAEQMTLTVGEIAHSAENARSITGEAVTAARGASTRVDDLGDAAQKIGKVTQTINEISEQTKMLALNATIEAARAGEAGKGFAVVANEIKELARQTAAATEEIRERIEGIQGTTAGTVTEIGQISKVIDDVNNIVNTIASAVEEQSITTRDIANNVSQASRGLQEVNRNVAQSSSVSGEIARDIADVNRAADGISNASGQGRRGADQLSGLAAHLREMVGRFRV